MSTRRNNTRKDADVIVDAVEVTEDNQSFFERNQRLLLGVVIGIILLALAYFIYQNFYQKPRIKEAETALYHAEKQFQQDSFKLALLGPGGGNMGLVDIIDSYGGTPSANLANYYAGVSYLHLGKYEVAIDYLKNFNADGNITPNLKYGTIGDAYSELKDYDQAISFYKKAGHAAENELLAPYYLKKLGLLYEMQGKYSDAVATYKEIEIKYPETEDGFNIEKYIARAESLVK